MWERLGHAGSIFDSGWPASDPGVVADERLELVIQVNGKTRGRVHVARDIGQDDAVAAALAEESIAKFLSGPAPRKVIFVPGRLLNLVG
jgi:leucyl-tRNA synthetase